MAPVGAAAFGVAPVLVGGAAVLGGKQSIESGVENWQKGNKWSAAFDFTNGAMALAPMGRNAFFGAEARAKSAQSLSAPFRQGWKAIRNPGQTLSGARNMATQAFNGAKNLPSQMFNGAKNLPSQIVNGSKGKPFQGVEEGLFNNRAVARCGC
jgi:hypothetical protein